MVIQTVSVDLSANKVIHKLTIPEGVTRRFKFTLKDQDDTAISLAGGSMTFAVYDRRQPTTGAPATKFSKTVGSGIVLTDAANGIATVTVAATDTDDSYGEEWEWELEFVDSGGLVWLAGYGEFLVDPARRLDGS